MKKVVIASAIASLAVFATLGLSGISMKAEAGGWYSNSPQPYNAICQSDQTNSGSTEYSGHDCGSTPSVPGTDGSVAILVPQISYKCFFLTDYTATNNNGDREVDFRNGNGGSRAFPPNVVLASAYDGTGPTLSHQGWQTPIVFTSNLYSDVHFPNNNIIITVSGYYDRCPPNAVYPANP